MIKPEAVARRTQFGAEPFDMFRRKTSEAIIGGRDVAVCGQSTKLSPTWFVLADGTDWFSGNLDCGAHFKRVGSCIMIL